ncbi:MAG: FecCD family ABC transporter permease [Actinomycetes bacterium]
MNLSAMPSPALPGMLPVGAATRRRRLVGLVVLGGLVVGGVLASVAVGAKTLPLAEVWTALVAPAGTEAGIIVRELRLPRTALAVAAGVALGLAGALAQGHTRNPLADPGLLGVNAGAAFAVVLAIYVLGVTTPLGYVWFALAGALLASVAVFALGSAGPAGSTPVTLALAGAAITAFLTSLTYGVVIADVETLDAFRFWAVGSVAGRDLDVLVPLLPLLLAGVVLALANGPGLNTLALGEDVARSLGQRVVATRVVGVAAVTLLTGSAVAMCGPIAFLGLVVPHVVRSVTGPDHRWLLPYSALAGAALLLAADVLGRVLVRPGELQVGVVLALVGAPFFIALVRRRRLVTS